MADVLFLAVIAALLGVSMAFIKACDRIIGSDDDVVIGAAREGDDAEEALAV